MEDAELELASAWKAPIVKKFFSLAVAAECEERRVGENGCEQSVARRRRNGVAQHSIMLTTSKNSHMKLMKYIHVVSNVMSSSNHW